MVIFFVAPKASVTRFQVSLRNAKRAASHHPQRATIRHATRNTTANTATRLLRTSHHRQTQPCSDDVMVTDLVSGEKKNMDSTFTIGRARIFERKGKEGGKSFLPLEKEISFIPSPFCEKWQQRQCSTFTFENVLSSLRCSHSILNSFHKRLVRYSSE